MLNIEDYINGTVNLEIDEEIANELSSLPSVGDYVEDGFIHGKRF